MPQVKVPNVNWIDEAWAIARTIGDMPTCPPGGLLAPPKELAKLRRLAASNLLATDTDPPGAPELSFDPEKKSRIVLAQDSIEVHLAYRLFTTYKLRGRIQDGTGSILMFDVVHRDPQVTLARHAFLRSVGVVLKPADEWAISAHIMLSRILVDGFVCSEWKQMLPLAIASISGPSTSESASLRAKQPRRPRPTLRDAKGRALARCPGANWKELLTQLQGDSVVESWDCQDIVWFDDDGVRRHTATGTFINY